MDPTLVILAGGIGSRYGSAKQLEVVGPHGETLIDYSVFDSIRAGFRKLVVVVQESGVEEFVTKITSQFTDRIDVEFVYQALEPEIPGVGIVTRKKPWGTGHALLAARSVVNTPFAVINADDYYGADAFKLMVECLVNRVSPYHYAMVAYELHNTLSSNGAVSRAVCELDDSACLASIVEREQIISSGKDIVDQSLSPQAILSPMDLVSMNFWGFHPAFFEVLEEKFLPFAKKHRSDHSAEFYIPSVVDQMLNSHSITVEVMRSDDQWYGLTYAQDRADVRKAILEMTSGGQYSSPLWG